MIVVQQNNEFQLVSAVLSQDLVAGQRPLWLVFPVVEVGQHVLGIATLSCE